MRGVRRSNLQSQPPAQLLSRLLEVRAAEVCDPARGTLRRSEEWAATRGDAMRRRRWGQADHSAANSADPPASDPRGREVALRTELCRACSGGEEGGEGEARLARRTEGLVRQRRQRLDAVRLRGGGARSPRAWMVCRCSAAKGPRAQVRCV